MESNPPKPRLKPRGRRRGEGYRSKPSAEISVTDSIHTSHQSKHRMTPRRLFVLAVTLLASSTFLLGQSSQTVRAVRIETPISIDGRLDEEAWMRAEQFEAPYEIDPRENAPAPQRTEIRIVYSQEMLYVSFVCHDSAMSDLRAHISDRDRMFDDDFTVLFLDTFGDAQKVYELFVNPVNVQGDILRVGEEEDDSYEMVWHSAATMHESLWIVEMGVPFKSLRFPNRDVQTWRIMAGRVYPRATRALMSRITTKSP